VATWNVDADQVQSALTGASGLRDQMAEQLVGSAAVGGTAGVSSWDSLCADVVNSAGTDGIVATAFSTFAQDQLGTVGSALQRFDGVLDATFQAAQALINGDDAMAASVVASHQSVLGGA
jgi:hypothetical protein